MTKDGPSVKNGEGPVPEASPGPSSRRGGNGAGGGCPPPPPPPRPSPSAPFHEDHRRELEALRTELEAERLRSQEARRRFALEARELREAAEKERQLLVDQLRSKWEQQRARELHQLKEVGLREREAEIRQLLRWKEAELRQAQELLQRERDAAMRQARDLQRQLAEELVGRCKGQGQGLSGEGRAKLQEVLGKLRWEVDGEQAARIRHLKAELELERSLFLKYILQRFEGEQPTLGFSPRGPKSGPHSLSSLMAACRASRSHSLEGGLNHSCESPKKQGRSCCAWSKSHKEQQTLKNILGKETSMETNNRSSQEQQKTPHITLGEEMSMENGVNKGEGEDVPLEEKEASEETGGQEQPQDQQAQEVLSGSGYDQLVKQNAEFLKALVVLEQRCTHLKNENTLLRKSSFPEMQDKVKRLKKKNVELASIAKRLEEGAKRLQESSLKFGSSSIPVAMSRSDMELYKTSFARQRAKDLSEQTSVILAKDQQLEALRRECWELHSKRSAGKESQYMLSICDFERLLRESQKEETQNILVNNVESESLPAGNGIENKGNSLLKTDPDTEYRLQVLTEELSSKSKECEILGREMEEKQKRCDDLETQLKEVLDENARITEENSHLEKKSEMAQKMENENTEINAKLMQATDARNSAVQLTKGLESKVENLEQIIRNLKEIVERRQQLVSEHEQTLLVLQTKDEEIQQLQQIQAKTKKENEETVEQLKARVKELENQRHSQTECFHRLSRAHGQLQKKKSEILELESSRASYTSESITYPPKGNEDNFHISGKNSIQNSSRSRSNPKEDTTDEIQEPETDKISMNLELENRDPTKLRVFLARYSYDPFDGPNKNPETELPLTAGEYVYICGEMDEDGFYEGELMDGRRGMIPSNLVEEVSGNDLISFHPLEASYHCYHEIGCPYRNASSEEGNDNTEEDLCINLLSNEFRGEIYNIYVNADLCCNVKHRRQMKAMIENLALKFHSYRISVQSVTDKGLSDKLQCTFLVGHGFRIAPTLLELRSVTATSAEITWLPSSSNYTHTVYLNEKEYDVTETGVYWYTFRNLKPNSQYHVKVEARAHFEELEQKSREMTFTTLLVGLPNPPLDVQVHPGSSAEFLNINWLPVTIDAAGSSNGVKVTGYAVYINGWKVTEVMSPTAGSVSLETTQLPMFHGPCMVFVKTLSPYGESVGSVPALIPAALLDSTHSSLPIPVAEHDDGHIATASNASLPFHSHLSTSNEDNNFTIHFTSSCKESDPSTPVDVSQNQESLSTWATLQNEDNMFSNLSSSVWKQSSECVFPASRWDKSAHYAQAESQDSQKKRSKKYLLSKKTPTLKSQPGSKKGSVHPVNISKDSFSQRYVENSGKCFWTPKSSVPSVEFLPQKGGSRRTGPSNICPEEEPDRLLERKHSKQIKQLCKAFSNTKEATAETEQISRPGSWRSPRGHHNNNSDSSEEEEYKIHFTCSKAAGMQGRPMSPGEAAENEMITRQTVPSLPNSSPQGNLMSGSTLKDDSERLFVALVDYDPLTMSPNSEAAGEELSFKEGQILKVFGDEDAKGFYRGECEEKQGYIPCHMVSEIYIESKEVKEHLLKNSYITEENL
uniref:TSPO associated protein 1 n=1 Tax=Anolis carolinensis TaxID=28377 RepID=H9GJC3_ANOCA